MFCPYCGNSCADSHKFCFRCGKPLPELPEEAVIPDVPETALPPAEPASAALPAETVLPETEAALSELPQQEETPAVPEEPTVPTAQEPKKGRLWPPILALAIMICVGLSAFSLTPRAPEPAKSCFTVESGILYFDPSLYTGGEELTVPGTVDGMTVTGISTGCFADCDSLSTIILPETVTVIGDKAFSGCDSLRGIYIPEGVLSIGADALAECVKLEAVSIPSSVMEVGEGCLDRCDSLQYLFYSGTYAQWRELYDGDYPAGMELHTTDGTFYAQP